MNHCDAQDSALMPGYRFLEHMTDAEVESYGNTLEEAFENAGRALEDTMVDISAVRTDVQDTVVVEGKDLESLLYAFLEALISKQDIEGMLYSGFKCTITKNGDQFKLRTHISGEKFDQKRHEQKTGVKSPTFHGMKILERDDGFTLRFLLDL